MKYDHGSIEKKWQERWDGPWREFFAADDRSVKPKYFLLIEFPYPSGEGLHMGHPRSYVALDIIARKRRMEGYNVLYPIGWDAFGLPAENYALKTGLHPRVTTEKNIANFRRQLKSFGLSFDWSREVNTTDPAYYKWTQWIFLQFYKHGLAYKARIPINWCPRDKIGLANEEVVGGCCERCGTPVEQREREQWMLKITAYAERLLEDLKTVNYLPQIRKQQEDWIGKSEGVEINFRGRVEAAVGEKIEGSFTVKEKEFDLPVFTTRPDTLFGVSYLVLAPEHPLVFQLVSPAERSAVAEYIAKTKKKTMIERTGAEMEKTGVPLGAAAIHPLTGEEVPIWIADYALLNYGTGAVMGVPAHDERDFEFAKKYGLEIKYVIAPPHEVSEEKREKTPRRGSGQGTENRVEVYTGSGYLVKSGEYTGLTSENAKQKIADALESAGKGKRQTNYHLRDWVFSRQRYWGEPIPIIHCGECGIIPVAEDDLPVLLPEVEKYQPTETGESPLATISDWVNTECPKCGGRAKRETDVMPNWAGSSWYFLRYIDPKNSERLADSEKLKYWMPIDWYNGGMEHTTLHLLYSRFWNKFLFDIGVAPTSEPYAKRTSHGLILGHDGEKMSKSRGNVINPDEIVATFGADALRVYEMFIGPFDQPVPWSDQGVVGVRRFLEKVYGLKDKVSKVSKVSEVTKVVHQTVKKVTEDIEVTKFNTAVSQMMVCTNALAEAEKIPEDLFELFLKVLSPFAPHLTEELWFELGHKDSIFKEKWPTYDPKLAEESEIELVVQVNGKVRDRFIVTAGLTEEDLKAKALSSDKIKEWLKDKKIEQMIVVRGRLVNIVTSNK